MQVNVIGKEFVSGTSKKTGKDFASNVAYVRYRKNGVEGEYVDSLWLDPNEYPMSIIELGKSYVAEYDSRGWLVAFYPVK